MQVLSFPFTPRRTPFPSQRLLLTQNLPVAMVSTRSQHNKIVKNNAAVAPPQASLFDTRTFTNLNDLISFVEIAQLQPEYGDAVLHLAIVMKVSSLERDIFVKILAACLMLTPSVAILEVVMTPPIPLLSIASISLPTIEVFKTNAPHRSLGLFVKHHPSLRAIELQSCGRTLKCSLASIDFHHITDIRCPVECAPGVVHGGLERLRLTSNRMDVLASDVLVKIQLDFDILNVLTIEFQTEDSRRLAGRRLDGRRLDGRRLAAQPSWAGWICASILNKDLSS
ncbi:hypothetical protein C8Q80DRAFT_1273019 [Daedaleopsis nitida]|nr:hypothetical protein C8Q80DRAFT_1273019 [Daedaleopsis nitida]